jgi:transcriptional regulator with XRE-family HTH domain
MEVRKRRLQKGMTQQQLASIINVDPSYVSKIERGMLDPEKQGPSETVVHVLAEALISDNGSVNELFDFFWMVCLHKFSKSTRQSLLNTIKEPLGALSADVLGVRKRYSKSDKSYYNYLETQVKKLVAGQEFSEIEMQNLGGTSLGEGGKQLINIVDENALQCTQDKIKTMGTKNAEDVLRAMADDLESTDGRELKKMKEELWMLFYKKKKENW